MEKESLLRHLLESFEREKALLQEMKEKEEREIEFNYLKEKLRLEEGYKKTKEQIIKELRKKIEDEYLQKELDLELSLQHLLIDKIKSIEKKLLFSLRDERYEEVFFNLFNELPHIEWSIVKISPLDKEFAKKYFPQAEIIEEGEITGGFIVISKDGRVMINNTFEKRAEKIRDEALLGIYKELINYFGKDNVKREY